MRLLLDSHVFLWWLQDNRRLARAVRRAIGARNVSTFVSAASIWEIAIKLSVGKLQWKDTRSMDSTIGACGFSELPVTARHAAQVRALPPHHGDPFDRLLIAQALTEGLQIVTADEAFAAYGVPLLMAED